MFVVELSIVYKIHVFTMCVVCFTKSQRTRNGQRQGRNHGCKLGDERVWERCSLLTGENTSSAEEILDHPSSYDMQIFRHNVRTKASTSSSAGAAGTKQQLTPPANYKRLSVKYRNAAAKTHHGESCTSCTSEKQSFTRRRRRPRRKHPRLTGERWPSSSLKYTTVNSSWRQSVLKIRPSLWRRHLRSPTVSYVFRCNVSRKLM